jgi:hypothetical protein
VTAGDPQAIVASDADLVGLLRVIRDLAERPESIDSSAVGRRLGWNDVDTAASLADARGRLLIWGMRVGGTPAPRFEDIELTVQGRRLLQRGSRPDPQPSHD